MPMTSASRDTKLVSAPLTASAPCHGQWACSVVGSSAVGSSAVGNRPMPMTSASRDTKLVSAPRTASAPCHGQWACSSAVGVGQQGTRWRGAVAPRPRHTSAWVLIWLLTTICSTNCQSMHWRGVGAAAHNIPPSALPPHAPHPSQTTSLRALPTMHHPHYHHAPPPPARAATTHPDGRRRLRLGLWL